MQTNYEKIPSDKFEFVNRGESIHDKKLETKAKALLYQYGDYLDKETVFEESNVLKTPTYVSVKGKAILMIAGQTVDLSKLMGDIALSTESLKELESVKVTGKRIVTVENLTSFHNYGAAKQESDDFVIYLGGFHNSIKRDFIKRVDYCNPGTKFFHFGDIDAGGFYILQHLRNQGRGRRLTVRAGHRQDGTGTNLEENFHLAGDLRTGSAKPFNCGIGRMHTRCAENQIRGKTVQIVLPYLQLAAQAFQFQHFGIDLFSGRSVAADDPAAKGQQQPHQRPVADTQTQNGDLSALQRFKICFKCTNHDAFPIP